MMHYVYIIQSIGKSDEHYVGYSTNPKQRLDEHNSGKSVHTNKFKPWKLVFYSGFRVEQAARNFETYLKSGSGRAFMKKHLL